MNNALRTRQRMFALALPLTAALSIGAEGIDPKGTDQIVTTTAVALSVADRSKAPYAALYLGQIRASPARERRVKGGTAGCQPPRGVALRP